MMRANSCSCCSSWFTYSDLTVAQCLMPFHSAGCFSSPGASDFSLDSAVLRSDFSPVASVSDQVAAWSTIVYPRQVLKSRSPGPSGNIAASRLALLVRVQPISALRHRPDTPESFQYAYESGSPMDRPRSPTAHRCHATQRCGWRSTHPVRLQPCSAKSCALTTTVATVHTLETGCAFMICPLCKLSQARRIQQAARIFSTGLISGNWLPTQPQRCCRRPHPCSGTAGSTERGNSLRVGRPGTDDVVLVHSDGGSISAAWGVRRIRPGTRTRAANMAGPAAEMCSSLAKLRFCNKRMMDSPRTKPARYLPAKPDQSEGSNSAQGMNSNGSANLRAGIPR